MSLEVLDILTLGNNKEFIVISKTNFNENEYVLLNEVDKNEEMLNNSVILKVVRKENNIFFEEIKDLEELESVVKQFENL